MIQVKEFLNYQDKEESEINKWLKEKGNSIKIINIKYGVSCFQEDNINGWGSQEFSGCLIVYKERFSLINKIFKEGR